MNKPTDFTGAAQLLFETGLLKRARRTGWWVAGISDPESIADHSFRTAVTGIMIASMEGADPARTSMLCVLHDTQETRVGDIPHLGRHYLTATRNEDVTADQVAQCPAPIAVTISEAVSEYEAQETKESICARDADKLECLIQALEYRHVGVSTVQEWIDSNLASLVTNTAKQLAQAALHTDPLAWQKVRADDA